MKNSISLLIIFCFVVINCFAKSQRLIVPSLGNVTVSSNGNIELTAYCIDATLVWPDYGNQLQFIYSGGDKSMISYSYNGSKKTVALSKAVELKDVAVVSSGNSVSIEPNKPGVKLLSIDMKGMRVGEQDEAGMVQIDENIFDLVPNKKPSDNEEWGINQQVIHRKLTQKENDNPLKRDKRQDEYYLTKFKNSAPQNWMVRRDGSVIKIHEKRIPNEGPSYHRIDPYDLVEAEYCLSLDSNFKLSISGTIKGAIPITIEFTSDYEIEVSASIEKEETGLPVNLIVSYSPTEIGSASPPDNCKITSSATICYPPTASTYSIDACGKKLDISIESISLRL